LIGTRGQIIALSSIAGFAPLWGRTGYCASKYALHGFLETLRGELKGDGVAVTLLCPSFVNTDFASRGLSGSGAIRDSERSTTGKTLQPTDVAEAIYRATLRRPRLVVLPSTGRLAYLFSRLAPRWYERIMLRRLADNL
jgi:short-subunit dehydrogenase